jgi:hypothetical protein
MTKQIGILRTSVNGFPSGCRVVYENADHKGFYKVWTSFSQTAASYVGIISATLVG